jgi:hypothetical protein
MATRAVYPIRLRRKPEPSIDLREKIADSASRCRYTWNGVVHPEVSSMALESAQVQRLSTMIAALSPRFDEIAGEFFNRFAAACPASKSLRPAHSRRARAEFAAGVAMVLKNVGHLEAADAVFEYASHCFRDAHVTQSDLQTAKQCLIGAVRHTAGGAWTSDAESDFGALINECFNHMNVNTSQPVARRAAA